ncbi:uncharacterized protein LOC119363576 [Triticum dicoccoides]|uniref:uncharacterized protein LOC119363576 n=1 Tax=Triticum dicoccoides TaxID=85692 RepID=UPI0018903203|nr:uncharacterized protein LOC119363576 [Triticum dicoccoides]
MFFIVFLILCGRVVMEVRLSFRRELVGLERAEWDHVRALTATVRLSDSADEVSWRLPGSGKFTVKSMYRELCRGHAPMAASGLWKARIPLKIKQWATLGRQQDADLHRHAIARLRTVYSVSRAPSPPPSTAL